MPFSLYVHIPYCLSKCPYCDFNAYAVQTWPEERYVDALCAELQQYVSQAPWQGQTVETLYFGGGTPSLFTPASIERFFNLVARLCPLAPNLEVTLEADPSLTVSTDDGVVPVTLESRVTEIGTLELWCHAKDSAHRWKLELNIREGRSA